MGKRVLASTGRLLSCSTAPVMRLERLSKTLAKAYNTPNEGLSSMENQVSTSSGRISASGGISAAIRRPKAAATFKKNSADSSAAGW